MCLSVLEQHVCILEVLGRVNISGHWRPNEMIMDDYDGQMMFGDPVGLKLPDIRLIGEEKPRKTSPRKLVPTGNRTRACCVASAHATTCSTVVHGSLGDYPFIENINKKSLC